MKNLTYWQKKDIKEKKRIKQNKNKARPTVETSASERKGKQLKMELPQLYISRPSETFGLLK